MDRKAAQSYVNDGDVVKPPKCGDLTVDEVVTYDPRGRFLYAKLEDGRSVAVWPRTLSVGTEADLWEKLNSYERSLILKSRPPVAAQSAPA